MDRVPGHPSYQFLTAGHAGFPSFGETFRFSGAAAAAAKASE